MSGFSYEDEIALLAHDIRRFSNNDGRIDQALTQMLKLVASECAALAEEARELQIAVVELTSAGEQIRIRDRQHNQHVHWSESK